MRSNEHDNAQERRLMLKKQKEDNCKFWMLGVKLKRVSSSEESAQEKEKMPSLYANDHNDHNESRQE